MKQTYPIEILPFAEYRLRMMTDDFSQIGTVWIHRRSDHLREKCFVRGIVDKIHLKPKMGITHLLHLSVNLLGGHFQIPNHEIWRQLEKGQHGWEGEPIDLNDFAGCYETKEGDYPNFYFKWNDIHTYRVDYPRTFPDQKACRGYEIIQKNMESVQDEQPTGLQRVVAQLTIEHSPNNLNYWHCQVECDTLHQPENERLGRRKATWEKELLNSLDNRLRAVIHFSQPQPAQIPESCYIQP